MKNEPEIKDEPELGKWYPLSLGMSEKVTPWRETHYVTKCMRVPGGVMIHNATYCGGLMNREFVPSASSESMSFVPGATFELDAGNNCVFKR